MYLHLGHLTITAFFTALVGIGFAVDLEASAEGAPFPSIEISAGVGAGLEFKVGLGEYGFL